MNVLSHGVWSLVLCLSLVFGGTLSACGRPEETVHSQGDVIAYTLNVGYQPDLSNETIIVKNAGDWHRFCDALDTATNAVTFEDYDEAFFAEGNILAIRYESLGSSGYASDITDMSVSEGTVTITYDRDIDPDALYTADMSGFIAVVEAPVESSITSVNLVESED